MCISVAGEIFPTRYHSTAHGISTWVGKIGAIIAQALIGSLSNRGGTNAWLNHMQIFALFMLCSGFTTLLIPETKHVTLEDPAVKYHRENAQSSVEYEAEIAKSEVEIARPGAA